MGISGRKKHRKKNIFIERTAGMPPLKVVAPLPGDDLTCLWEMDGLSGYPMKQLVFQDEQNKYIHLRFVPGQLAKDFEYFYEEQKDKQLRLIAYFYDTSNPIEEQEIEQVCMHLFRGTRGEPEINPKGGSVLAQMQAEISVTYKQAIAKIGFHFVLAHFAFTGLEPQFDDIKRFIFTGKNCEQFVQLTDQPFLDLLANPNAALSHSSHLLSAEYDCNAIEARMQFFAGPKVRPLVWRVMVGPSLSSAQGVYGKGFCYCYYDVSDQEGYLGEMNPLQRLG